MELLNAFDELYADFRPHFKRMATFERGRTLAFSTIVTYGRRTISRLICTKNEQNEDWSADYKFFSTRKWDASDLFFEILKICNQYSNWKQNSILVALDDTLKRKTGKKIPGVSTLRDPMSLPFHINLTPCLRFIQGSAIINPEGRIETSRAIPIHFEEAAPAQKPKKNAPQEVIDQYKKEQKEKRISVVGRKTIEKIRNQIDQLPNGEQYLLYSTEDGSYCNRNFLRHLPERVIAIVRSRKDLRLFKPAKNESHTGKGRHRIYGERLPTPEQIRKDDTYLWKTARVFASRKYHDLRYKVVMPVLWQRGTGKQPYRLIIIAPLRYRKKKNSKLLYRDPTYLMTQDLNSPIKEILQYYFLRWDIEVNHRDEKSLIGVGDAQVRSVESVDRNPQFTVIIYGLLLLASIRAYGSERTNDYLPLPSWRKPQRRRPSTLDIIAQFRREVMQMQLGKELECWTRIMRKNNNRKNKHSLRNKSNKTSFVENKKNTQSAINLPVNILAAMLYADS
jgi:hypothetical protein